MCAPLQVLCCAAFGAKFLTLHSLAPGDQGKPIEQKWDEGKYGLDDLARLYKGKPFESHKANFYRCIREGGLPVSDVFSHVQTMSTCHLCAITARLGRVIRWDPKAEKILGDDQAAAFFARKRRLEFDIPKVL
jgi:myo-inositol 2-dehydrogenase/D-chiro-inositol 1-dehydrogenase